MRICCHERLFQHYYSQDSAELSLAGDTVWEEGDGTFFFGTNIPSTGLWHRPTFSREKRDQRAEFSLFEETKLPKSALYLCLRWTRRWWEPKERVVTSEKQWTLVMELFSRWWKWRAKAGYIHHPISLYCMWFYNWCVLLQRIKHSDWNHSIAGDWDLQKEPFSCSKSPEPAIALLPPYALGTPQWS